MLEGVIFLILNLTLKTQKNMTVEEQKNKMLDIHRIIMNYYKFTTTTTFSNEEDERSYTKDLLDEITKIIAQK